MKENASTPIPVDFLKKLASDPCICAMLIALILGLVVFFPLSIIYFIHTLDFSIFLSLFKAFALIAGFVSGSDYIGKSFGLVKVIFLKYVLKKPTNIEKICDGENIGATVGVVIGAVLCPLSFLVFHEMVEYNTVEGMVLFVFSYFSAYGGLSNRIGRGVIDRELQKILHKKVPINYAYGIRSGLICSVILILALLTIALLLHLAGGPVGSLLLVCVLTIGFCVSASGYIGRAFDWFFGEETCLIDLFTDIEKRKNALNVDGFCSRFQWKKLGTCIGFVFGITLGILLVCFGLSLCPPALAIGVPFLIKGALTLAASTALCMGFGTRVGAIVDFFVDFFKSINPMEEKLEENKIADNSCEPPVFEDTEKQKPAYQAIFSKIEEKSEQIDNSELPRVLPCADVMHPAVKDCELFTPKIIETKSTLKLKKTGYKFAEMYNLSGKFGEKSTVANSHRGNELPCLMPLNLNLSKC